MMVSTLSSHTRCRARLFNNVCGSLQLSQNKQPSRHLQRGLRNSGHMQSGQGGCHQHPPWPRSPAQPLPHPLSVFRSGLWTCRLPKQLLPSILLPALGIHQRQGQKRGVDLNGAPKNQRHALRCGRNAMQQAR